MEKSPCPTRSTAPMYSGVWKVETSSTVAARGGVSVECSGSNRPKASANSYVYRRRTGRIGWVSLNVWRDIASS